MQEEADTGVYLREIYASCKKVEAFLHTWGQALAQAATRFLTIPAASARYRKTLNVCMALQICMKNPMNKNKSANTASSKQGENRGLTVGVEEIVTGHAGLTGDTGRDNDNLYMGPPKKIQHLNMYVVCCVNKYKKWAVVQNLQKKT